MEYDHRDRCRLQCQRTQNMCKNDDIYVANVQFNDLTRQILAHESDASRNWTGSIIYYRGKKWAAFAWTFEIGKFADQCQHRPRYHTPYTPFGCGDDFCFSFYSEYTFFICIKYTWNYYLLFKVNRSEAKRNDMNE